MRRLRRPRTMGVMATLVQTEKKLKPETPVVSPAPVA